MFHERTAWFSSSVGPPLQKYWISEGGHIVGLREAEYLFSEDATSPDTLRLFESSDYHHRKATVFHSLFLRACERRSSSASVCIGHYVLPPVCVQDEVRNVVGRLIWELEDEQPSPQDCLCNHFIKEESNMSKVINNSCDHHLNSETSQHDGRVCWSGVTLEEVPVNNTESVFISMDMLKRYSGDLCEFIPDYHGCTTTLYR